MPAGHIKYLVYTIHVAHNDPPNQQTPKNGNNSCILFESQTSHRGHIMQVMHAYNTGQASMSKTMTHHMVSYHEPHDMSYGQITIKVMIRL